MLNQMSVRSPQMSDMILVLIVFVFSQYSDLNLFKILLLLNKLDFLILTVELF